nr:hypothetical protein GCM10025699_43020 [Microbacterium flavescens]
MGVVTTILATPPAERDPGLADAVFEGVLAQILTDAPAAARSGHVAAAVAFRAVAPDLEQLSGAERRLLREWLDRIISEPPAR